MSGREAASRSPFHAALRFHDGQPVIYSTIVERMYVQTNYSLEKPVFEEITWDFEELLSCEDWEPWDEPKPN